MPKNFIQKLKSDAVSRRFILVVIPIIMVCIAIQLTFNAFASLGEPWLSDIIWLRKSLMFQTSNQLAIAVQYGDLSAWQSAWMMLTYGFVHVSSSHLFVNMLGLLVLGYIVIARVDIKGFLIIYTASMIAGAFCFSLFKAQAPMAGSSGAIYGLAGALMYWNWADYPHSVKRYVLPCLDFLVMFFGNIGYYMITNGGIAWQAHVGGFFAGFIYALIYNSHQKE